jgi:hypothetical protein
MLPKEIEGTILIDCARSLKEQGIIMREFLQSHGISVKPASVEYLVDGLKDMEDQINAICPDGIHFTYNDSLDYGFFPICPNCGERLESSITKCECHLNKGSQNYEL